MRLSPLCLAIVVASSAVARAQPADPVDPYAPAPPPPTAPAPAGPTAAPPTDDDVLVAKALVARARQLLDAGFPEDARQLAEEALLVVSDGETAAAARAIVDEARRLIAPAPVAPRPPVAPVVEPPPVAPAPVAPRDDDRDAGRRWLGIHGMLTGAALGGGIGLAAASDSAAATPIGAAAGAITGFFVGRWAARRYRLTAAESRTIGSGGAVGAVAVGLLADVADVGGTSPGEVGVGVAIGAAVGTAAGAVLARRGGLSTGDVALMDSFALYGVAGGLSVGALMQPAKREAYSLNAVIGGVGGWLAGAVLGPRIDASPRRVGRMVLGAVALGGAPWLLYLGVKDDTTHSDERAIGLASTLGVLTGAYLGYRWSRGMAGEDRAPDGRPPADEPVAAALLSRTPGGRWRVLPVAPHPATSSDGVRGWMVDLAGGAF